MAKPKKPPSRAPGRHDLYGAAEPANGFPVPPLNCRTAIVAVPDPHPDLTGPRTERRQVLARLDLLESELKQKLLTEEAYAVGRDLERIFERAEVGPRSAGFVGATRGDPSEARIMQLARGKVNAETMKDLPSELRLAGLGQRDIAVLFHVLRDRKTYREVAAMGLEFSERARWAVAQRFRLALEDLANAKAQTTGPDRGRLSGWRDEPDLTG